MNEDIFEYILSPKKILIMKTQLERSGKAMKLKLNKKTILRLDRQMDSTLKNGFYFMTWDEITGCTSKMTNDLGKMTK